MTATVAKAMCGACERLHKNYERATAIRLQAEADFLATIRAKDSLAADAVVRTLHDAVTAWKSAVSALRNHTASHLPHTA